MSQSLLYHAFGVRDGYQYRRTDYVEGRVEFHLEVKLQKLRCPERGGDELWQRGPRHRRIKAVLIGAKEVVFIVEVPRCECQGCGKQNSSGMVVMEPSLLIAQALSVWCSM